MLDWATQDYIAALQLVLDTDSTSAICWLGHSLGGQVFPLVDNISKLKNDYCVILHRILETQCPSVAYPLYSGIELCLLAPAFLPTFLVKGWAIYRNG
ncbi:hypothetical protein GPSY_1890 [Paraglaciecola psychrophila 170]|nr:hypothetical protein GPSY_1890 [Paraglaciecola psychrophila 170]